jgi:hypothetical protein
MPSVMAHSRFKACITGPPPWHPVVIGSWLPGMEIPIPYPIPQGALPHASAQQPPPLRRRRAPWSPDYQRRVDRIDWGAVTLVEEPMSTGQGVAGPKPVYSICGLG